jgi:hypothetical protein
VGPKAGLDTEATGNILSTLPVIEPLSPGRPTRSQTLYCLREVVSTSEKSVNFRETTRRKIPQDSYLYLLLFNKNQLFFVYYSTLGTKSQTRHCSVLTSVLLHNSIAWWLCTLAAQLCILFAVSLLLCCAHWDLACAVPSAVWSTKVNIRLSRDFYQFHHISYFFDTIYIST